MSAILDDLPADGSSDRQDHIVQLHGVSWSDYLRVLAIRGEHSAPRITYLEGVLQIMSPAYDHEAIKSIIGCLVEAWCLDHGVEFTTVGAWTIKKKRVKRGVEPDECWVFGDRPRKKRPDLAVEVIWTSGGIDKLDVYRKLGVREVWIWDRAVLTAHQLVDEQYQPVEASVVLPGIDLSLIQRFCTVLPTSRAIREFRAAVLESREQA